MFNMNLLGEWKWKLGRDEPGLSKEVFMESTGQKNRWKLLLSNYDFNKDLF